MHFQTSLIALGAFASLVAASPYRLPREKRAEINDTDILNYALTLEYLERDFYAEGLKIFKKSDFAAYPFDTYARLEQIASHEREHVEELAAALDTQSVSECKYNFGIADVPTFLAIARVLESVGVTAFLGATPDIQDPAYLSIAASILAVDSRHNSWLDQLTGISPFPSAYNPALYYSQVYTLAASFIVPGSCNTSASHPPGIHAYPALTVMTSAPVAGKKVGLHFPLMKGYHGPYYATFVSGSGPVFALNDKKSGITTIPASLANSGLNFVFITKNMLFPSDTNTIAGPVAVLL